MYNTIYLKEKYVYLWILPSVHKSIIHRFKQLHIEILCLD